MGPRHGGEEAGLPRIGVAHEAHVGDEHELQPEPALLPLLPRLGEAGGLAGRADEVHVAPAARAAPGHQDRLPFLGEVGEELSGVGVKDPGPPGNLDDEVLPPRPCCWLPRPCSPSSAL